MTSSRCAAPVDSTRATSARSSAIRPSAIRRTTATVDGLVTARIRTDVDGRSQVSQGRVDQGGDTGSVRQGEV
ncbi:hypothetical protein ADK64_08855 [Streptomyces sp. MMG1121]|nr:hypothetical protein ADK64_08855 [Streptomyces sp. MMG1121]